MPNCVLDVFILISAERDVYVLLIIEIFAMANCEPKRWLFIALLKVRSNETFLLFYSKDKNLYYIIYFCVKVAFTVTTTTLIQTRIN